MTEDEWKELEATHERHILEEEQNQLSEHQSLINAFKGFSKQSSLILSDEDFRYIERIGIVACAPNILSVLNSKIRKNKEGLVPFGTLNQHLTRKERSSGFLYSDNYTVMAHPYFRRSFFGENSFAPRFVELFWEYSNPDVDSYVSLDFDRVRIDINGPDYLEKDTWYGASFSQDIGKISDGVVKLRPPFISSIKESLVNSLFSEAYSLDIKWDTDQHGIRTFQAEEFKTDSVTVRIDDMEYHPVRYIHAEFDVDTNYFRHFDGALHLYLKNEYFLRRDSNSNYNTKHSTHIKPKSVKLFKMNGKVDIDTWTKYTSQFMPNNPLVIEYFEGKSPDHITEMIDKLLQNN